MVGLVEVLLEVIETSKRNTAAVEKLINLLENPIDSTPTNTPENPVSADTSKGRGYREDNVSIEFTERITTDQPEQYKPDLAEAPLMNVEGAPEPIGTEGDHDTATRSLATDEYNSPKITALNKLGKDIRDQLLYGLYQTAKYNVKNIIGIDENAFEFEFTVREETDRLLDVWIKSNQKK